MSTLRCLCTLPGIFAAVLFGMPAGAEEMETLLSPNSAVKVTVTIREEAGGDAGPLSYAVEYRGKSVLLDSPMALEFKGTRALRGLEMVAVARSHSDTWWQRLYGKRSQVRDDFNKLDLELQERTVPKRRFKIEFRVYDDGVAFRYSLPDSWGTFELVGEHIAFRFPDDATVWAANYGGFHSPQEGEFKRMKLSELAAGQVYGCSLLAQLGSSLWAACTEANLTDWAGMYFTRAEGISNTVQTALSPHPDEKDVAVRSTAPRSSPWRVIMIGERPGAFIESDLLENLNPPAPFDAAWVKPGKSAWDIWWSGGYAPELDFKLRMDTRSMKYFVDLAAEMGWQYQIVDWQWYGPPFAPGSKSAPNPSANITNVVPELNLPELIAYAKKKNVRLFLWLQWASVEQQMDAAFPVYEKWGIAGVKIDFMDRDDQAMVQFYERVAKKAAEHHLLVDFHGAYKPTGWHRTYPNVITREGVLGNEYNKWSARVTPEHAVTLPFTRGMLGGMDFTPGGFRQKTGQTFRAVGGDAPGPFVMGTRAHELAMLVVYESALQVMCDSPYNYRSSPAGTDFLKMVPTTWDDTRVLEGEVGRFITVVRRAGKDWYLASMAGAEGRTLKLPLSFLDEGKYEAEIWEDAYEAADFPDRLMKNVRTVSATDILNARLAPAGGCVVRLRSK